MLANARPPGDAPALVVGQPVPATAARRPRSFFAFAVCALLAAGASGLLVFTFLLKQPEANAQPASVPASVPGPDATPIVSDHDARLNAALHELQAGATCGERKQAIAKLVELRDPKAVAPLRSARGRGKGNACLRGEAAAAIRALDGRI
jgi:hypothetical protein